MSFPEYSVLQRPGWRRKSIMCIVSSFMYSLRSAYSCRMWRKETFKGLTHREGRRGRLSTAWQRILLIFRVFVSLARGGGTRLIKRIKVIEGEGVLSFELEEVWMASDCSILLVFGVFNLNLLYRDRLQSTIMCKRKLRHIVCTTLGLLGWNQLQ